MSQLFGAVYLNLSSFVRFLRRRITGKKPLQKKEEVPIRTLIGPRSRPQNCNRDQDAAWLEMSDANLQLWVINCANRRKKCTTRKRFLAAAVVQKSFALGPISTSESVYVGHKMRRSQNIFHLNAVQFICAVFCCYVCLLHL